VQEIHNLEGAALQIAKAGVHDLPYRRQSRWQQHLSESSRKPYPADYDLFLSSDLPSMCNKGLLRGPTRATGKGGSPVMPLEAAVENSGVVPLRRVILFTGKEIQCTGNITGSDLRWAGCLQ